MADRRVGNGWLALVAAISILFGLPSCSPPNDPPPRPSGTLPIRTLPPASGTLPVYPRPTAGTPRPTLVPSDTRPPEPTEGATPTVPPGQRSQEILERCFAGKLAFRPPSPLQQGDVVEFVVRVALATSPVDPATGLPGTGEPTRRQPPICERMQADLTSSGGVKIERASSELISIPEKGAGEWAWHLTALESGRHEMVLRLLAPDPDGGTIIVETFRETITVDVGVMYVVTTWIKEMAPPLQALLGIIVILGGWALFLFTRRWKRGKHAAKARSDR